MSSWVQYSVFCKAGEQVKITDKLKTVGQAVCSTCMYFPKFEELALVAKKRNDQDRVCHTLSHSQEVPELCQAQTQY